MAKFKIGNVSAKTLIVGDSNIINQMNGAIDYYADEALSFFNYNVKPNYYLAQGHTNFGATLNTALQEISDNKSQLVFLNHLNNNIQDFIRQYKSTKNPDSENIITLNKMAFLLDTKVQQLQPMTPRANSTPFVPTTMQQKSVFISYARADKAFLEELKKHFKPIKDKISFWDDSKIKPGQKWKEQIQNAMHEAKVALLLLSPDFFNSEFISNEEMPKLLSKASSDGTKILTVIVRHCLYDEYPEIMEYQAINDPKIPIASLDANGKDEAWVNVVKAIRENLQ